MGSRINLLDKQFGKLTVKADSGFVASGGVIIWECLCNCGKTTFVQGGHLRSGHTKSCGCKQKESVSSHKLSGSSEYSVWAGMKNRCFNSTDKAFLNYGAKGITVCDRWLEFENFILDMGLRPSLQHSIDRKNNLGNYEPSNCAWVTSLEQGNNKSTNVFIHYHGVIMTISNAARLEGVCHSTIRRRAESGKYVLMSSVDGWVR